MEGHLQLLQFLAEILTNAVIVTLKRKIFLSKAYNESSIIMEAKTDTPTRCVWYHNFSKKQTSKLEIYGTNQIIKICVKSTELRFVSYKDVILRLSCAFD